MGKGVFKSFGEGSNFLEANFFLGGAGYGIVCWGGGGRKILGRINFKFFGAGACLNSLFGRNFFQSRANIVNFLLSMGYILTFLWLGGIYADFPLLVGHAQPLPLVIMCILFSGQYVTVVSTTRFSQKYEISQSRKSFLFWTSGTDLKKNYETYNRGALVQLIAK